MDFRFSDDQRLFADTVRAILAKECPPAAVRAAAEAGTNEVDGLWAKLAATGLIGLTAPETAGGLGLGQLDFVLIAEELGRAACPDTVLEHVAVGLPLLAAAPSPVRERWLEPAAIGEVRVTGSLGAPHVAGAATADLLILNSGDEVHAVAADNVTLTERASVDGTRALAAVAWTPSDDTLITDDAAVVERARWCAAVAGAAQCVGVGRQLLDLTVGYVGERHQFGSAIGVNQAVKHHLANVGKALEFARPMVHRAAWCLDTGNDDVGPAVAMAKALASDAVDVACRAALQCHGAIAYTVEYDLQLWLKRGWVLSAAWGSAADHRRRLGDAVLR